MDLMLGPIPKDFSKSSMKSSLKEILLNVKNFPLSWEPYAIWLSFLVWFLTLEDLSSLQRPSSLPFSLSWLTKSSSLFQSFTPRITFLEGSANTFSTPGEKIDGHKNWETGS